MRRKAVRMGARSIDSDRRSPQTRVSTLTLEVDLAAPVSRAKRLIESKWVIPVRDQLLWFSGCDGDVLLRDQQPLGTYGVAGGADLRLELRAHTPPPL